MAQAKSCDVCSQAHDCKRIYQQLGRAAGPSVVMKVLLAFVLPIIVFSSGLAAFGHFLRLGEPYQTPVVFVLSLLATVGAVLGASSIARRLQ